jgi:hypothetical protein
MKIYNIKSCLHVFNFIFIENNLILIFYIVSVLFFVIRFKI